jgi:hypothetical protein
MGPAGRGRIALKPDFYTQRNMENGRRVAPTAGPLRRIGRRPVKDHAR